MKTILITLALLMLAGCATYQMPPDRTDGIYHKVAGGETLWSISKTYGPSVDTIVDSNRLPNADRLSVGQLIFIPNVKKEIVIVKNRADVKYENFIWPVTGKVISHFGSLQNSGSRNKGIDVRTALNSDIMASRSGRVTYCSRFMKGYGKIIILDHSDGYQTIYAYNSLNLVKEGDWINQRQVIAKSGKMGRAVEPSLHFEIRKAHQPKNPFYYLP